MSYGVTIVFRNGRNFGGKIELQVKDGVPFEDFCTSMARQGVHYLTFDPNKAQPVEGGEDSTRIWIPPHQITSAWVSVDDKTGE